MKFVTSAKFRRLLPDVVEMEAVTGELIRLDRTDIEDPTILDFHDDMKVEAWFRNNSELLIVSQRVDPSAKYLVARRFSFLSTPAIRQIAAYQIGAVCEMQIADTNTRLYAYGELPDGLEARCEKRGIRQFLKARGILPLRQHEGRSPVGLAELSAAEDDDDDFWLLHYPEYELSPGDTVMGCVTSFEIDDQSDYPLVLLDIRQYLEQLDRDSAEIIMRLGARSGAVSEGTTTFSRGIRQESLFRSPGSSCSSILLLDDEINGDLRVMESSLRMAGFDVTACSTLDEAKAAVNFVLERPGTFHAALIDINLQNGNPRARYQGIHFALWLQKRIPLCAIYLMSGESDRETDQGKQETAEDLLIADYLPKPFTAALLRKRLLAASHTPRVLARERFSHETIGDSDLVQTHVENGRLRLDNITNLLKRMASQLQADNATVFRMHKISRAVSLFACTGATFPRYREFVKALRYSPIRDVCEDREELCHREVGELWATKHRNLLLACDSSRPYTACVACPVPEPPGDDHWYSLFAFVMPDSVHAERPPIFQVNEHILQRISSPTAEEVRDCIVLHLAREYASYISHHILERWHENTQVRQYSFLMTGIGTCSIAHDLANSLMGSEHMLSSMAGSLHEGANVSSELIDALKFTAERVEYSIGIASSFKKQARAQCEPVTKFKIEDCVQSAVQAVSHDAEQNRVSVHYGGDESIVISCQRGAVERILFNLILNAVQQIGLSIRKSGWVYVDYSLRDTTKGMRVVVQVYDTGPGIQGYRHNIIFNPGETTRRDGSGMGLAIAREETKRLRGEIRVAKSLLFCGSCFEFTLPIERRKPHSKDGESA